MYGFCLVKGVGYWVLESMSYGFHFPAYQLGSSKILWVMREYGLPGVWVKRVSTVLWEGQVMILH
ncbi:hypothetical protein L208DRAFT_1285763 [Tricholoma matsutake]|nr:hypothetical protein L208DRAFT_1285763 [Tricholoma matsutake 945]